MIGQIITDPETGLPLDRSGNRLAESSYQPPKEVMDLFAKVQHDYQIAYQLQHRPFKEFDGYSLLDRARLSQELFGVYVGCEYVAAHKRWRWKGRKNTARNKIIYILARAIAGMLYPYVSAKNNEDEQDKMTAKVAQILVKDFLTKAKYDVKFLYFVLSALVNPAVFVEVEFLEVLQTIKRKLANGKYEILQAVDELLSGLQLNTIPIDEILLPDFFSGTGRLQNLPVILRVRRISYDQARAEYAGKHYDSKGKDLFDYVQAGKTRIFIAGQENQTLYDIEWTEADANFVQVIVAKYRSEDLEVDFVGGVGMVEETDVYNSNPFKHRRMTLLNGEWLSIPVYNIACAGFEPLDPAGRFFYYKSAADKEFWDDATLNKMHQLAVDGTYLDVIKPTIISGVAKVDSTVMVPGGVFGVPNGSQVSQYQIGPNLKAAWDAVQAQNNDMDDSTKANPAGDKQTQGVTATQTNAALQQAKLFYGVFGIMLADLTEQIGQLTMDCIVENATVGELDATVPGALSMKYKTFLTKGKEKGKNVTHKIVFTDKHIGREYTPEKIKELQWQLSDKSTGTIRNAKGKRTHGMNELENDQRLYEVNPYQFARYTYSLTVDADTIIMKSMGQERAEKDRAFQMLSSPNVLPFTDPKAVAEDFVIEEYGGDDPDKYKKKGGSNDMLNSVMGNPNGPGAPNPQTPANPGAQVGAPTPTPQLTH